MKKVIYKTKPEWEKEFLIFSMDFDYKKIGDNKYKELEYIVNVKFQTVEKLWIGAAVCDGDTDHYIHRVKHDGDYIYAIAWYDLNKYEIEKPERPKV